MIIHRGRLEPEEIRHVHGLPVTSPARMLQDLAASVPAVELARLVEEMRVRGLVTDVEVDGFEYHGSRQGFERARRRDAELQALGHRVLRITGRQLVDALEAVVAVIAAALSAARCA